ncbi:nuclear transport factor 2 family protein [Luteimonas sp. R10]|uniref:nuclear transport factor 2 family protein n=1 Tax=Luteimonas sp. R10 TaxID=3108176 RepID=UPI00308AB6B0|nr:nuclear transport factor 2 family protein [Luteimonas sp. R10]
MKAIRWCVAAALAASALPALARDAAQDRRDILEAEAALSEAFENRDADALRAWLDERFVLTGSNGIPADRAQTIAEVESGEPAYDVFRNRDQVFHLYGDAAVVTGITSVEGKAGGEPFAADFQFTDTWVYRDGRWRLAASHATRISTPRD